MPWVGTRLRMMTSHRCGWAPGRNWTVAARFLALFKPLAVGANTWGLGAVPPKLGDKVLSDHAILLKENGIYILETMDTGRLASEGVTEFMFVLGQARLKGALLIIINPVAMR